MEHSRSYLVVEVPSRGFFTWHGEPVRSVYWDRASNLYYWAWLFNDCHGSGACLTLLDIDNPRDPTLKRLGVKPTQVRSNVYLFGD